MHQQRIRRLALASLPIFFLALVAGRGRPQATSGERIVFTSDRSGNNEVYAVFPSGAGLINLTNHPASDSNPVLSPDGTQVAFVSDRSGNPDIWVMKADGSLPFNITNSPAISEDAPAWSPDGTEIAYQGESGGNSDIYRRLATGDGPATQLTSHPGYDGAPSWSETGMIAFESDRDGQYRIWTMTDSGASQMARTTAASIALAPDFSPDGARIAFSSNRTGEFQIHTMPVSGDSSDVVRVSDESGPALLPSYAPDGAAIVYVVVEGSGAPQLQLKVRVLSSGEAENPAPTTANDTHADWYKP